MAVKLQTRTYDRRFTPVVTVIFQINFLLYSRGAKHRYRLALPEQKGEEERFPSRLLGRPS